MKSIHQIIINTLTGWGAVAVRTGLAFFIVPFLLSELGREAYGLVGLLMVLMSLAQIADLGLSSALGREMSEMAEREEWDAYNQLASTALFVYLLIGSMFAIGCYFMAPHLVSFFKIPSWLCDQGIASVRLYGIGTIAIFFIRPVFYATLTSRCRFDLVNNIQTLTSIVSSVLIIAVLKSTEWGLFGWIAVMLAGHATSLCIMIVMSKRTCSSLRLSFDLFSGERLRSLLGLGWKVYILQLTNLISERSDPLVVSRFFHPSGVAIYSAGSRLSAVVRPIILTLSNQLYPFATRLHIKDGFDKQRKMLVSGTKYTLLLGALSFAGLFVLAEPFCKLWLEKGLGQDYRVAAQVVRLWAVVDFMVCTASLQWPILLGMRKMKVIVWVQVVCAILNVALSIYFTGYTSVGLVGVLWGTVLTAFIRRPVLIWYGARVCGIPLWHFIRTALLRPFLVTILLIVASYILLLKINPTSYLHLIVCGSCILVIWGFLLITLGFTRKEFSWILQAAMKIISGKRRV